MCVQLKILACNISGGNLQGEILVNGSLVNPKEFRKQSAVVWQSDVLLATATVRPQLRASVRLWTPPCISACVVPPAFNWPVVAPATRSNNTLQPCSDFLTPGVLERR